MVVVAMRMVMIAPAPEWRGRMMMALRSKERMILEGCGQLIPERVRRAIQIVNRSHLVVDKTQIRYTYLKQMLY
jgi:hypothetical protein